jgi:hypothetical protein
VNGFSIRGAAALLLLGAACLPAAQDWKSAIRRDHPRLFFNRETWPAVKARALGEEAAAFAAMRARADELAARALAQDDYGTQAAEAAFVFLVTGEPRYRDLGARLLSTGTEGQASGFIRRTGGGAALARELIRTVMPQTGLYGAAR